VGGWFAKYTVTIQNGSKPQNQVHCKRWFRQNKRKKAGTRKKEQTTASRQVVDNKRMNLKSSAFDKSGRGRVQEISTEGIGSNPVKQKLSEAVPVLWSVLTEKKRQTREKA